MAVYKRTLTIIPIDQCISQFSFEKSLFAVDGDEFPKSREYETAEFSALQRTQMPYTSSSQASGIIMEEGAGNKSKLEMTDDSKEALSSGHRRAAVHMNPQQLQQHVQNMSKPKSH